MQPTVQITPEVLHSADLEFNRLRFVPVHSLAMDNHRLVITPEQTTERTAYTMDVDAKKYLATMLGVPLEVISKIDDPALTGLIWNYYINQRGSDVSVLKAVTIGEAITGFTTRS